MIKWILENKEWLFSGIGLSVFGLIAWLFRKLSAPSQAQRSGRNSINIQAGANIYLGDADGNKKNSGSE